MKCDTRTQATVEHLPGFWQLSMETALPLEWKGGTNSSAQLGSEPNVRPLAPKSKGKGDECLSTRGQRRAQGTGCSLQEGAATQDTHQSFLPGLNGTGPSAGVERPRSLRTEK